MFFIKKQDIKEEWTVYVGILMHCPLVVREILKIKGELIAVYESFGIIIAKFEPRFYEHVTKLPGVRSVEK